MYQQHPKREKVSQHTHTYTHLGHVCIVKMNPNDDQNKDMIKHKHTCAHEGFHTYMYRDR